MAVTKRLRKSPPTPIYALSSVAVAVHRTPYPPGASMTGPNNPLSEHPRCDLRGSLAGARSANTSRVDLLPTPSVGNDNDTSTSSTGGLFSYLGDEPSFVASRARDDAQGSLHGVHGEAHPRGAGGRLENRRATAPHDFRASTTRKTAPPPDAQQEKQGTTTSRRPADEAAELFLAPALDAAATAGKRARASPFYLAADIIDVRLVSVSCALEVCFEVERAGYTCNLYRRHCCSSGNLFHGSYFFLLKLMSSSGNFLSFGERLHLQSVNLPIQPLPTSKACQIQ